MKEVLLLGDSIRQAYQSGVVERLSGIANVSAPGENCRFAAYTLNSLRWRLPGFPKPDVIHWNNGLWDLAILYGGTECFTTLDNYMDAIKKTLEQLRKTGAQIIFATTTPCHPDKGSYNPTMPSYTRNADVERYNAAVVDFMEKENIPINDLWSVVYPHIFEYISEDLIHPNDAGKAALADAVADKIKQYLG